MSSTDTISTYLQLLLMGDGLHPNDWGDQTNTNLTTIESAIAATEVITLTGNLTLTQAQAVNAVLSFKGTPGNATVTMPSEQPSKLWLVVNNIGAVLTLALGTSTVALASGSYHLIYCDGTNLNDLMALNEASIPSDTVLANLGSGTQGVTYSALKEALGLNSDDTPTLASLDLSGAAGTTRQIAGQTSSSNRIVFGVTDDAETGGNAGSNFIVECFADNGSTEIGAALFIVRQTLAATFGGSLTATGTLNAPTVQQGGASLLPSGTIIPYAAYATPAGWLYCNGQAVSRTTFAELFSAIGTTYGSGDGSTTFNVPDFRGYFLRGYDDGAGVDPGRGFASEQADQVQNHTHLIGFDQDVTAGGSGATPVNYTGSAGQYQTGEQNSGNAGAETRPKNYAIVYLIKT